MKLKSGFLLHELAGETFAVAVDPSLKVEGMISLNESAKLLWQALEVGAEMPDLVKVLRGEYEVDEALANKAAGDFVNRLRALDILED